MESPNFKTFCDELAPFNAMTLSLIHIYAAIAGKAMAELAATRPNTGGAGGCFAGNNDIDVYKRQALF